MRTTIALDDDVLLAAKAIAAQQRQSLGRVISDLARRSLHRSESGSERNGVPLLKVRPGVPAVTLEIVNGLRDELP